MKDQRPCTFMNKLGLLNHSYHKLKIQLQDLVARKMLQYKLLIPSEQNWKFKSSSIFCYSELKMEKSV